MSSPHIEFLADEDPLKMLDTVCEIATPILEACGYEPADRGVSWAHWERDFHTLVRAYAFRDEGRTGVSLIFDGEAPFDLSEKLAEHVRGSTGWSRTTSP